MTDDCNTNKSRTGYYATAVPIGIGTTGQRGFSTAAHGTIYFDVHQRCAGRDRRLATPIDPS